MTSRTLRNLALFGIFTSLGYVAFAAFVSNASAAFLLVNTYLWLFVFRVFSESFWHPRWPLSSLKVSVDTKDLSFAVCIFCYWSLFWFGIKFGTDGGSASQSAIAFLSLNSVLLPIASHFATMRSRRGRFLLFYLLSGLVLAFSVMAIEFDSPAPSIAATMESYLYGLKLIFTDLPVAISRLYDFSSNNARISVPALCFIMAIAFEALGDYFIARREEAPFTHLGSDLLKLQKAAAEIVYVKKFIASQPLDELACVAEEAEKIRRALFEKSLRDLIMHDSTILLKSSLDLEEEERRLVEDSSINIMEARNNLSLIYNIRKHIKENGERTISRNHRNRLFRIVEERCWAKMLSRASVESKEDIAKLAEDCAKNAGSDLMATLGLALSIVIFLATGAVSPHAEGKAIVGLIVGIVALGALGSSARLLFITPLIRKDAAIASLVPPIYAVRPVIYFLIVLSLQNSGFLDYLVTSGAAPAANNLKSVHNEGWFFGTILAGTTAIVIWVVSIFDVKRRRTRAVSRTLQNTAEHP